MRNPPPFELRALGPRLGAEMIGFDLAKPLPDDQQAFIKAALRDHVVLCFRDQSLGPEAQIALTAIFGEVEPHPVSPHHLPGHPEVLVLPNRPGSPGRRNDFWHSDITFSPCPPAASLLHALEVTEGHGDTLFCDMCAAFDDLSPGLQTLLRPLRALHSIQGTEFRQRAHSKLAKDEPEPVPVEHPVVCRHLESGRATLFVNSYYTDRFADMTAAESQPILDHLADRATRPENVYRHRWRAGDVIVWDNLRSMHYAVYDYDETMPRHLHRTTAKGHRPVAY